VNNLVELSSARRTELGRWLRIRQRNLCLLHVIPEGSSHLWCCGSAYRRYRRTKLHHPVHPGRLESHRGSGMLSDLLAHVKQISEEA